MAEKEIEIITDKEVMRKWSRSMRVQGKTIGLVPTMGYLHQGHLSLIKEAQNHAQVIVVSIYVNPSQFSASEDLTTYPSDFHGDIQKLKSIPGGGVDVVFHPQNLYDYGEFIDSCTNKEEEEDKGANSGEGKLGHETWVRVERLEKGMCGKSRPIHFKGVATIVTKLFNIVEPDIAAFGKKDYQQWRIICRMVRDLDFSVKVVGCEIMRDADGLAMSSRNVKLSPDEREKALSISRSLSRAKSAAENGQISCKELRDSVIQAIQEASGKVDYAEIVDQECLEPMERIKCPVVFCVAAWFGKSFEYDYPYGVPLHMWGNDGLGLVANYLGKPLFADDCTLNQDRLAFARVCIEIGLDFDYPTGIPLLIDGKIELELSIEYQRKPTKYEACRVFGHSFRRCTRKRKKSWVHKVISGLSSKDNGDMGNEAKNGEIADTSDKTSSTVCKSSVDIHSSHRRVDT